MQILIVAATPFEIAPTLGWLEANFAQPSPGVFEKEHLAVQCLITGVGMTATAFHLGYFFAQQRPDWAVNAGIAGALDANFRIGEVLQISTERFGDLGVEEADGRFTDWGELGFAADVVPNFPQVSPVFHNPGAPMPGLLSAQGMTVNKVHGTTDSIQKIREKYPDAQVESMEGAAFFYACLQAGVSFAQLRAISNRVEPRNRAAWDIPLAIKNVNEVLQAALEALADTR